MSYQVIARKWRPQSFDEVSGQAHVTTALRNAIRTGRIPHAMLLTGPRGVGKTTLARLIARCLNCEKGPTDQPCGSCPACEEITEGRSTDVQEIDAASRTGVDDIREVIESIRYAAAPGKYRIFIVDEVHMLSPAAFNALLKTLEEPPPRSLFVLATTNPEKIPFTVLSRCQRHDLRRIALTSVTERLAEICESEGIKISAAALISIAREGDGSMRDAQTLLDQIVAYSGGAKQGDGGAENEITNESVADVLDLVDRRVLRSIVEACIESDAKSALEHVVRAASGGSEARRIADALLELLRDLVVLRVAPDGVGLFEGPDEERAELIELASRTEPARLRRMFRALVREIEDLSWAPQPTAVLEMAVIRLATMPAGDDVGQLLARLDQLERRLATGGPATGGTPTGGGQGSSGRASSGRSSSGRASRGQGSSGRSSSQQGSGGQGSDDQGGATPAAGRKRSAAVSDRSPRRHAPEQNSGRGPGRTTAVPDVDAFDAPKEPDPGAVARTDADAAPAESIRAASGAPELRRNGREAGNDWPASRELPSVAPRSPASDTPGASGIAATPATEGTKAHAKRPAPKNANGLPTEPPHVGDAPEAGPPQPGARPPAQAPTIGGGAESAILFDRFRTKALDTDRARFASLDGTSLVAIEGNMIRIGAPAAFHAERLRLRVDDLESLATNLFGQPTRISVEVASGKLAQASTGDSREHSRKRRQEALNSESVNLAIEVLDAEIVEIRPLGDQR